MPALIACAYMWRLLSLQTSQYLLLPLPGQPSKSVHAKHVRFLWLSRSRREANGPALENQEKEHEGPYRHWLFSTLLLQDVIKMGDNKRKRFKKYAFQVG